MKGIMVQGTSSDAGKSFIVTALCRMFANEGLKTAPFKSQNMSNNSYVTKDGKEIGRAQGIQAEAAKTEASVWMNPILLKPRSNQAAEVVYLGKATVTLSGREYRDSFYDKGIEVIKESLKQLEKDYDIIVLEGAGSPVEINLKERELVNMKVAELADVPVILVADIDRGGVFASIVGTLELLEPEERKRVCGIIINKFRGDLSLFDDGIKWLEERTGIPVLGVLPYMDHHMVDGEDSLSIQRQFSQLGTGAIDVAAIHLPFISNYSDLEPFLFEDDVRVRWVKHRDEFGSPDAVIIPGTKSTIADLKKLKETGLDQCILDIMKNGGFLAGICGGYQILGEELIDEAGSDTGVPNTKVRGLGVIPAQTIFQKEKATIRVEAHLHSNTGLQAEGKLNGYEIHLGQTFLKQSGSSFLLTEEGREEGYFGREGQVIGTYFHHLFHNDEWRNQWLNLIRSRKGIPLREVNTIGDFKDKSFDDLAAKLKSHLKWNLVKDIIHQWRSRT
ncbi:cobyric acid synthase [Neobacillus dielmonensis]|uniref:cobyric acid synthase n=1 Tax=Neobacillus dielmonensis TaxID=1347369 RepID=UPI0005A77ABD|nr:cobyric acid synthase [Neobacillus dielmonensis]